MSFGRRSCTAFARQVLKDPCSLQRVPGSAGKRSSAWTEFSIHFQVQFSNTCPEALQTSHGSPFCATVKRLPSKSWKKTYWHWETVVVGLCTAILLWYRNFSMKLVQCLISIMLYSGVLWSLDAWSSLDGPLWSPKRVPTLFSLVSSSVSSCVKVCLVFKIFSNRGRGAVTSTQMLQYPLWGWCSQ